MIVTPFARELKRYRAERGLTARGLAVALGKSVAYVGKIEAQGEVPSIQLIREIARVLEANPDAMLRIAKETRLATATREIGREYSAALAAHQQPGAHETDPRSNKNGATKMATVLSLINMKGGVGKTTLAMQLAHTARAMKIRTLAVDLDPQSNLSQALLGPPRYVKYLESDKPTVVTVFDGYVPTDSVHGSPRTLDINEVIVHNVGGWKESTLDLIPSRLELSRTLKNPYEKGRLLAKALAQVRDRYDLVIIDCAPTESVLTDAAYFASRYIIVPIKPEFMATVGLPLLARSLEEFQLKNDDHKIGIAGLVFNHSASYSAGPEGQRSIKDVTKVAKEHGWHICENQIRYSASYAKSAREGTSLAGTSYARYEVVRGFNRFAEEVFELIGMAEVPT